MFRIFIRRHVCAIVSVVTLLVVLPLEAQQDCYPSNNGMRQMEPALILFSNDQQKIIEVETLVADDPLERASGYQHICPEIIARTTILFRYSAAYRGRFHMNNVKAPLDIGFFDENGVLIQSMLMNTYDDGTEVLYGPVQPFQYALEASPGFYSRHQLSAGKSRLIVEKLP